MDDLQLPMRHALELAWASARAGSLGIGAVVTDRRDNIVASGRNRLAEHEPADDVLAGSSLAHAELNALAKLRWGAHESDHLTLWTTLEPCLQCSGAIRMAPIAEVHVLAPDPLFRNMDRMRDINEFVASQWPTYNEYEANPFAVFALLLQTHALAFWGVDNPAWSAALPRITALARELAASGALIALAAEGATLDDVLNTLWSELEAGVNDVAALWAV